VNYAVQKIPVILVEKLPPYRFGEPFISRLASLLPKPGIIFEFLIHGLTPMADIPRLQRYFLLDSATVAPADGKTMLTSIDQYKS